MAIYQPEAIKNKCIKTWHNCIYQKLGEMTNPAKDGNWHINPEKYHILVDVVDCNKCTQEKEAMRIAAGELQAINEWRLANGLEPK